MNGSKAVGQQLEYGETLLEIMQGLHTGEIFEGLWLGQVGDACHKPFLEFAGITQVVNCAAEVERPELLGIEVHWLKWRDSAEQGKAEHKGKFQRLQRATEFMHRSIEAGHTVLVHCVQGVSRSSTVVVAYLMQFRGLALEDAIATVRQKHPAALRPFPFQDMLVNFHHFLCEQRAA
eukprot:TRINITY_DN48218_c0_g1_i2.p1 TRINITY_DN48218_c0_g1~~TRINITY_DN48218_c0_g1_i2.p1  ORF type:complete len:177 (+),score=19.73 TRINITY_DN48218_c0_g1_i2:236-766(+)